MLRSALNISPNEQVDEEPEDEAVEEAAVADEENIEVNADDGGEKLKINKDVSFYTSRPTLMQMQ